jgi:predicted transcriptional regulator
MDRLAEALCTALHRSPAPRRALCRAAGIEQSLLARILAGDRRASPALVRRVARALERWGTDCAAGASILRRALKRKG